MASGREDSRVEMRDREAVYSAVAGLLHHEAGLGPNLSYDAIQAGLRGVFERGYAGDDWRTGLLHQLGQILVDKHSVAPAGEGA